MFSIYETAVSMATLDRHIDFSPRESGHSYIDKIIIDFVSLKWKGNKSKKDTLL